MNGRDHGALAGRWIELEAVQWWLDTMTEVVVTTRDEGDARARLRAAHPSDLRAVGATPRRAGAGDARIAQAHWGSTPATGYVLGLVTVYAGGAESTSRSALAGAKCATARIEEFDCMPSAEKHRAGAGTT